MKTKFRMLSKEVAPGDIRIGKQCGSGSCPSVIERSDGKFVIVGKLLSESEQRDLDAAGIVKVYKDESAILIDPLLIQTAMKQL